VYKRTAPPNPVRAHCRPIHRSNIGQIAAQFDKRLSDTKFVFNAGIGRYSGSQKRKQNSLYAKIFQARPSLSHVAGSAPSLDSSRKPIDLNGQPDSSRTDDTDTRITTPITTADSLGHGQEAWALHCRPGLALLKAMSQWSLTPGSEANGWRIRFRKKSREMVGVPNVGRVQIRPDAVAASATTARVYGDAQVEDFVGACTGGVHECVAVSG